MDLSTFDALIRSRIDLAIAGDSATNGLQVSSRSRRAERVACSVDASMQTFKHAVEWGADVLFVHHGLFWGHVTPVVDGHFERLAYLIEHDLALYAVHLPLDRDPLLGNNAVMATHLGLRDLAPFGRHQGEPIGCSGTLPAPMSVDEVTTRLFGSPTERLAVLGFGPERSRSIAIMSGSGGRTFAEAVAAGHDLYLTGDASHIMYHEAREARINVLFAGHYRSEIWGVRAVAGMLSDEGLDTTFIDVPTGL